MSNRKSNLTHPVTEEINREHLRELCIQETEQLAELSQQLTELIQKQDTVLKQIEIRQQRILGILRCEIQHAFIR
jgi:hypothetical protein